MQTNEQTAHPGTARVVCVVGERVVTFVQEAQLGRRLWAPRTSTRSKGAREHRVRTKLIHIQRCIYMGRRAVTTTSNNE